MATDQPAASTDNTPPIQEQAPKARMEDVGYIGLCGLDSLVLTPDTLRAGAVEDPESIRELAESIYKVGLLTPITVRALPMVEQTLHGRKVNVPQYEVTAGRRRIQAIQLLIAEGRLHRAYRVRVNSPDGALSNRANVVLSPEDAELHRISISVMENGLREPLPHGAIAKLVARLADNGMPQVEIARMFCKSPAWVSQHVAINRRCCEDVKEALDSGVVSAQTAYSLSQKDHEEQKRDLGKITRATEKAESLDTAETVDRVRAEQREEASGEKVKKPNDSKLDAAILKASEYSDFFFGRGVYLALQYARGYATLQDFQQGLESMTDREEKKLPPVDPAPSATGGSDPDALPA